MKCGSVARSMWKIVPRSSGMRASGTTQHALDRRALRLVRGRHEISSVRRSPTVSHRNRQGCAGRAPGHTFDACPATHEPACDRHRQTRAAGSPPRGPRPRRRPHLCQRRRPVSRGPGADHRARPRQPRLGRRRQRVRRVRLRAPRRLARARPPDVVSAAVARRLRLGRQLRPADAASRSQAAERFLDRRRGHGQVREATARTSRRPRSSSRARPPAATWSRSARTSRSSPPTTGSSATPPMPAGIPPALRDLHRRLPVQRPRLASRRCSPSTPARSPASSSSRRRGRAGAGLPRGPARACATAEGALLVFDEMITGFRWHARRRPARLRRAPRPHDVRQGDGQRVRDRRARGPRASSWSCGGIRDDARARVPAVDDPRRRDARRSRRCSRCSSVYEEEGVIDRLDDRGRRLAAGVREARSGRHGLEERVLLLGRPCNLVFGTLDGDGQRSQPFRTLFLQELIDARASSGRRSWSARRCPTRTSTARSRPWTGARASTAGARRTGSTAILRGRPVKPVFRPYA